MKYFKVWHKLVRSAPIDNKQRRMQLHDYPWETWRYANEENPLVTWSGKQ